MNQHGPHINTLSKKDLALYEEIYGLPYMFERIQYLGKPDPNEYTALDGFMPRVPPTRIDPDMGVSGIEEELIDSDYAERQIKKYHAKLEYIAKYHKVKSKQKNKGVIV